MYSSTSACKASASIRRAPSRTISSINAPLSGRRGPSASAAPGTTVSTGRTLPTGVGAPILLDGLQVIGRVRPLLGHPQVSSIAHRTRPPTPILTTATRWGTSVSNSGQDHLAPSLCAPARGGRRRSGAGRRGRGVEGDGGDQRASPLSGGAATARRQRPLSGL